MHLYHGSPTPHIRALQPCLSNHGKPYAYLTDCPELAVIYAWNPVPRPYTYFPYERGRDGTLYYDEYFPNAMETVYRGHGGYIYCCCGKSISIICRIGPAIPMLCLSALISPACYRLMTGKHH